MMQDLVEVSMTAEDRERQVRAALEADVPDVYSNTVMFAISPYDLTFMFGRRVGAQIRNEARVTMSLEHAVVMLMVARRTLREHVKRTGVQPSVPAEVMRELQLDEEAPLW
jgi:hypothetical protein